MSPLARTTIRIAAAVLLLMLLPAIAMQFTEEVNWGMEDFAAAGGLLFCAGMAFPIAARLFRNRTHRAVAIALVLVAVGTVWAHLAVGLFA